MKKAIWMLALLVGSYAHAIGPFDPGPFDIEQPPETDGKKVEKELASS